MTRKLFQSQRGSGWSSMIERRALRLGCVGKPVGSSWYSVFVLSAVETMKYSG